MHPVPMTVKGISARRFSDALCDAVTARATADTLLTRDARDLSTAPGIRKETAVTR